MCPRWPTSTLTSCLKKIYLRCLAVLSFPYKIMASLYLRQAGDPFHRLEMTQLRRVTAILSSQQRKPWQRVVISLKLESQLTSRTNPAMGGLQMADVAKAGSSKHSEAAAKAKILRVQELKLKCSPLPKIT